MSPVRGVILAGIAACAMGCAPARSDAPSASSSTPAVTSESHAGHQVPAATPQSTSPVAIRINSDAVPGPAPQGMVWIPGGTFWMGCEGCGMPDALPVHVVEVDGFWMDRTPVTNAEFQKIRRRDWLRHRRRASVEGERLSRRVERSACAGLGGVQSDDETCSARQSSSVVALHSGRKLEASAGIDEQRAREGRITPLCTWRSKMCRRTRSGPASGCPPRPSSSSPRADGSIAISIRGATT